MYITAFYMTARRHVMLYLLAINFLHPAVLSSTEGMHLNAHKSLDINATVCTVYSWDVGMYTESHANCKSSLEEQIVHLQVNIFLHTVPTREWLLFLLAVCYLY